VRPLGLLFGATAGQPDYGTRLSRLRWRRAFPSAQARAANGSSPAAEALAGVPEWIAVRNESWFARN
jgi:hypothetical protein